MTIPVQPDEFLKDELSQAEMQVLIVAAVLEGRQAELTPTGLSQTGGRYFGMYLQDWNGALEALEQRSLLARSAGELALSATGRALGEKLRIHNPKHRFFYDEYFTRTQNSPAHARFCERVYGENLCQHGMLDMEQLRVLESLLEQHQAKDLLELGCGNGMIAEHISDALQIQVTGIDTSRVGIQQALARTDQKRTRLNFLCEDMRALQEFAPHTYDAVVAIDSLYFIQEFAALLDWLGALLRPSGRMFAFYSLWSEAGPDDPALQVDGNPFAKALRYHQLPYEALDFTPQEIRHWQIKAQVAAELKGEFEAEGNHFLYDNRYREAASHLRYVQNNSVRRFLYQVSF